MGKGIRLTNDEREMLRGELAGAWSGKMLDYCTKEAAGYWQADDGTIEIFDKPHIQTEFWFGEDTRTADEWREHQAHVDACSKSEAYFRSENMRWFDCKQKLDALDDPRYRAYVYRGAYCGQKDDCKLGHVMLRTLSGAEDERARGFDLRELTADEIDGYRAALRNQVSLFDARLTSYLKRYGLSKCHFGSYWTQR